MYEKKEDCVVVDLNKFSVSDIFLNPHLCFDNCENAEEEEFLEVKELSLPNVSLGGKVPFTKRRKISKYAEAVMAAKHMKKSVCEALDSSPLLAQLGTEEPAVTVNGDGDVQDTAVEVGSQPEGESWDSKGETPATDKVDNFEFPVSFAKAYQDTPIWQAVLTLRDLLSLSEALGDEGQDRITDDVEKFSQFIQKGRDNVLKNVLDASSCVFPLNPEDMPLATVLDGYITDVFNSIYLPAVSKVELRYGYRMDQGLSLCELLNGEDRDFYFEPKAVPSSIKRLPVVSGRMLTKGCKALVTEFSDVFSKADKPNQPAVVLDYAYRLALVCCTELAKYKNLAAVLGLGPLLYAALGCGRLSLNLRKCLRKSDSLSRLLLLSSMYYFSYYVCVQECPHEELSMTGAEAYTRCVSYLCASLTNLSVHNPVTALDVVDLAAVGMPDYLGWSRLLWLSSFHPDSDWELERYITARFRLENRFNSMLAKRLNRLYHMAQAGEFPNDWSLVDDDDSTDSGEFVSAASEEELVQQGPKSKKPEEVVTEELEVKPADVPAVEPPKTEEKKGDDPGEKSALQKLYDWLMGFSVVKYTVDFFDQIKKALCSFFSSMAVSVRSIWNSIAEGFNSIAKKFQQWINDLVGKEVVGNIAARVIAAIIVGLAAAGLLYAGYRTFGAIRSMFTAVVVPDAQLDDDGELLEQGDAPDEVVHDSENGGRIALIPPRMRELYYTVGDWTRNIILDNAPTTEFARAISNINAVLAFTRSARGAANTFLLSLPLWCTWWLAKLFPHSPVGHHHRTIDLYNRGVSLRVLCRNAQMLSDPTFRKKLTEWVHDANALFSENVDAKLGPLQTISNELGGTFSRLLTTTNFVLGTPEPLGVCWLGKAGTLKSTCIETVVNKSVSLPRPEAHGVGGLPALYVNPTSSFCDGLQDHTRILVFDDALSVLDSSMSSVVVSSLLQLISPTIYMPVLPSLEPSPSGMKGTVADIDYVLMSSNIEAFGESGSYLKMADPSAFTRRFRFIKAIPRNDSGYRYDKGHVYYTDPATGKEALATSAQLKEAIVFACGFFDKVALLESVQFINEDKRVGSELHIKPEHIAGDVSSTILEMGSILVCGFDKVFDVVAMWGKAHFDDNPWADSKKLSYADVEPYTSDPTALVQFIEEERRKYNQQKLDKLWSQGAAKAKPVKGSWAEVKAEAGCTLAVDPKTSAVLAKKGSETRRTPFFDFKTPFEGTTVFEENMRRLCLYNGVRYSKSWLATVLFNPLHCRDWLNSFVANGGSVAAEARSRVNYGLQLDKDGKTDPKDALYTSTRGGSAADSERVHGAVAAIKSATKKSVAWNVDKFLQEVKSISQYNALTSHAKTCVQSVIMANMNEAMEELNKEGDYASVILPNTSEGLTCAYVPPTPASLSGNENTLPHTLFRSYFTAYANPVPELMTAILSTDVTMVLVNNVDMSTEESPIFCAKCGQCLGAHVGHTHGCTSFHMLKLTAVNVDDDEFEAIVSELAKVYVLCNSVVPALYPAFDDLGSAMWKRVLTLATLNTAPMYLGRHTVFLQALQDLAAVARTTVPSAPEPLTLDMPDAVELVTENPSWFTSFALPAAFFGGLMFFGFKLIVTGFQQFKAWRDQKEASRPTVDLDSPEFDSSLKEQARYTAKGVSIADDTPDHGRRTRSQGEVRVRKPKMTVIKSEEAPLVAQGTEVASSAHLTVYATSSPGAAQVASMRGITGYGQFFLTYSHAVNDWKDLASHPEYYWVFQVYASNGSVMTFKSETSDITKVIQSDLEDLVAIECSVLPLRCTDLHRVFLPAAYFHLNKTEAVELWREGERTMTRGLVTYGRSYSSRYNGEERRKPQYSISYPVNTVAGDCGSAVVIRGDTKNNLGVKVVGMHIAGNEIRNSPNGMAILITMEIAAVMFDKSLIKKPEEVYAGECYDLVAQESSADVEYAVAHGIDAYSTRTGYHVPTKSAFTHSPFFGVTRFEQVRHPAILSPSDERNPMHKSPFSFTIRLLVDSERETMDVQPKILDRAVSEVFNEFNKELVDPCGELGVWEVIQGLPGDLDSLSLSTSAGYPYVCHIKKGLPTTRRALIDRNTGEMNQYLYDRISMVHGFLFGVAEAEDVSVVSFPKDELQKQSKIDQVATRCVECFPLDVLIAIKTLCGRFIQAFNSVPLVTSSCVGLNMQSTDAHFIAERVTNGFKWTHVVAGDYSKFDCSYSRSLLRVVYNLIYNLAGLQHRGVVFERFFSLFVDIPAQFGRDVFYFRSAHYSGGPFTTIVNILANDVLMRCAYYTLGGDCFDEHVRCCFLGDDNLVGTDDETKWFNQPAIGRVMEQFGFTYTNARKTHELLEEDLAHAEFMGCSFNKVGGWYYGALRKASLENLGYRRKTDDIFLLVLSTFVTYSAAWGEEYFNEYQSEVMRCANEAGVPYLPLDYYTCLRKLREQATQPVLVSQSEGLTVISEPSVVVGTDDAELPDGQIVVSSGITTQPMTIERGLASFMPRGTFTWTSGEARGNALLIQSIPLSVIEDDDVTLQALPFHRFAYFRGTLVVRVTCDAPVTVPGRAMLVLSKLSNSRPLLTECSLCPNVVFDPSQDQSAVLSIPFEYNREYLYTGAAPTLGTLYVIVLSPLVGDSSIVCSWYTAFENCVFQQPKRPALIAQGEEAPSEMRAEAPEFVPSQQSKMDFGAVAQPQQQQPSASPITKDTVFTIDNPKVSKDSKKGYVRYHGKYVKLTPRRKRRFQWYHAHKGSKGAPAAATKPEPKREKRVHAKQLPPKVQDQVQRVTKGRKRGSKPFNRKPKAVVKPTQAADKVVAEALPKAFGSIKEIVEHVSSSVGGVVKDPAAIEQFLKLTKSFLGQGNAAIAVEDLRAIGETFASSEPLLRAFFSFIPLDDRPVFDDPKPIIPKMPSFTDAYIPKTVLGFSTMPRVLHEAGRLIFNPEELDIASICEVESLLATASWTTADKVGETLFELQLDRQMTPTGKSVSRYTVPVGLTLINMFEFASFVPHFKLVVVKTKFHTGRLSVSAAYGRGLTAAVVTPDVYKTDIITLDPTTETYEFEVPWGATQAWYTNASSKNPTYALDGQQGVLAIKVANPLVSTNDIVSSTVDVQLYVSFREVHVSMPASIPYGSLSDDKLACELVAQSGVNPEPMVELEGGEAAIQTEEAEADDEPVVAGTVAPFAQMPYCETNILELCRRYVAITVKKVGVETLNGVNYERYVVPVVPRTPFNNLYCAWCGSLCYRVWVSGASGDPVFVTYSPDNGSDSQHLIDAHLVHPSATQAVTNGAGEPKTAVANGAMTFPSAVEVLSPLPNGSYYGDFVVPFSSNLSYLYTPRTSLLVGSEYPTANGCLTVHAPEGSRIWVWQACGDDFLFGMIAPTSQRRVLVGDGLSGCRMGSRLV